MIGIVWYKNREKGEEQFEKIIGQYEGAGINLARKNQNFATFENGDVWRIVSAVGNSRGIKANISYVEKTIDKTIFNNIIIPSTTSLPYQSFSFYGEGDLSYAEV